MIPLREDFSPNSFSLWQEEADLFLRLSSIAIEGENFSHHINVLKGHVQERPELESLLSLLVPPEKLLTSVDFQKIYISLSMQAEKLRVHPDQSPTTLKLKESLQELINYYEFRKKISEKTPKTGDTQESSPCTLALPNGKLYLVPQQQALDLVQRNSTGGIRKRDNKYGLHNVLNLKPQKIHLKNQQVCIRTPGVPEPTFTDSHSSITPWMESGVNFLVKNIVGEGCAPVLIAKLSGVEFQPSPTQQQYRDFILQASSTVEGIPMTDIFNQEYSHLVEKIDHESFSFAFFLASICHFQDGKPENLILECFDKQRKLMKEVTLAQDHQRIDLLKINFIDNEPAFVPSIVKVGSSSGSNSFLPASKSILFLMKSSLMKPIHQKVVSTILSLNAEQLILEWLIFLYEVDEEYKSLLETQYFTSWDYSQLKLPIKLAPDTEKHLGTVSRLYTEIKQWQSILSEHPNISHLELFYRLDPIFAHHNLTVLNLVNGDPLQAMSIIYSSTFQKENMGIEESLALELPRDFPATIRRLSQNRRELWKQLSAQIQPEIPHEELFTQPLLNSLETFLSLLNFSLLSAESQTHIWNHILQKSFPPIQSLTLRASDLSSSVLFTLINSIPTLRSLNLSECHNISQSGFLLCLTRVRSETPLKLSLDRCLFVDEDLIETLCQNYKRYQCYVTILNASAPPFDNPQTINLWARENSELICDLIYAGYFKCARNLIGKLEINLNVQVLRNVPELPSSFGPPSRTSVRKVFQWHLLLRRPHMRAVSEALRFLLQNNFVLIDDQDSRGHTAAHIAATLESDSPTQLSPLKTLLSLNSRVGRVLDNSGQNALFKAVITQRFENCVLLVESGVDLSVIDHKKRNVIHHAVMSRNFKILQYLLDVASLGLKRILLDSFDDQGQTPLHLAAAHSDPTLIRVLLSYDADPNISSPMTKFSALHVCIDSHQYSSLPVFVQSNRVSLESVKDGSSPLDLFVDRQMLSLLSGTKDSELPASNSGSTIPLDMSGVPSLSSASSTPSSSQSRSRSHSSGGSSTEVVIPPSISYFFLQKQYDQHLIDSCDNWLSEGGFMSIVPPEHSRTMRPWLLEQKAWKTCETRSTEAAFDFHCAYREAKVAELPPIYLDSLVRCMTWIFVHTINVDHMHFAEMYKLVSTSLSKTVEDFDKEIKQHCENAIESKKLQLGPYALVHTGGQPKKPSRYFFIFPSLDSSGVRSYFLQLAWRLELLAIFYGASIQSIIPFYGPGTPIGRVVMWISSKEEFSAWKTESADKLDPNVFESLKKVDLIFGDEKFFSEWKKKMRNRKNSIDFSKNSRIKIPARHSEADLSKTLDSKLQPGLTALVSPPSSAARKHLKREGTLPSTSDVFFNAGTLAQDDETFRRKSDH